MIYNSLIDSRSHRPRHRSKGYELHHITPRSIGGADTEDNLICLTPKEHFIAHRLLVKIHTGDNATKMALALHRMATGQHKDKYRITARTYQYLRTLRSNAYQQWLLTPEGQAFKQRQSKRMTENNPLAGIGNPKRNGGNPNAGNLGWNKGKRLPSWTPERRARFKASIEARKRQSH